MIACLAVSLLAGELAIIRAARDLKLNKLLALSFQAYRKQQGD